MIQVAIKKQLAQRSQNLPASRTKPQSQQNLSQPVTCSEDDQNTNYPDNFMTQDFNQEPFRLHSNFYHKNRLTPSQKHTHDIKTNTSGPSSSNNHHQHGFDQRQAQSHQYSQKPQAPSSDFHVDQTPQGTSIARDDTDPSQPIESLVDPHCVAGPSLVRPSKTDRPADPIEMNPNSTEAVNYHTGSQNNWANLRPQNLRMRPLVYDPEKNPYPPPEKLVENQIPHRIAGHQPSVPFSSQLLHGGQNHSSSLPPSSTFSTHLSQQSSMPFPSTQKSYPFPSSSPPPKFPNPQIPITSHQSASTLPGSSSQQVHNFVESNTNFNSATSSLQQHSNSTYASANPSSEINPQNMKRRPSKLVKLRRPESRGSTGSSIGQRSIASFDRIKNFVGALHKRVSRGSQSWDESDSTQDQGPSTPSPLDLSASGGGFDSEGNEKLRPMQAQFHRLFRKHRHPEHLRRQNRSMLVNKSLPLSQQPIKGKSRALNFGTSPSPINARVLGMGRNDELVV
ncbi:hypothetical protein O181_086969 [Austropuccinia psidii MF-1]|uniref:Uncharacterized protein n=1 Tax=Austropuccinia psidii MF-1 TaxID=1389203 RepID=A0A9Q3INU1_9BASI|nr:hypothetical protein [Austropuccinia psidii MF-1]